MQKIQRQSICDLVKDIKTIKTDEEIIVKLKEACAKGGDEAAFQLFSKKLGTVHAMKKTPTMWVTEKVFIKKTDTKVVAPEPAKKDPVQIDPKPQKQPVIR